MLAISNRYVSSTTSHGIAVGFVLRAFILCGLPVMMAKHKRQPLDTRAAEAWFHNHVVVVIVVDFAIVKHVMIVIVAVVVMVEVVVLIVIDACAIMSVVVLGISAGWR